MNEPNMFLAAPFVPITRMEAYQMEQLPKVMEEIREDTTTEGKGVMWMWCGLSHCGCEIETGRWQVPSCTWSVPMV